MRIKIFSATIFFFFIGIIFGLFYLEILGYDLYKNLSEKNRIRVIPMEAPRGKIYDRSGKLLVNSRIAFDVETIYQELEDEKKVITALSGILGIDRKTLYKKLEESRKMPFIPVAIAEDVEKDKAIQVEEARLDLPGLIVTPKPRRNYIYKNTISHVTGYIGKISESELTRYKTYGYTVRDFVGKDGLERRYNDYLRGLDGGVQIEVDSKGRQQRLLAVKESQPGRNLYLSIDIGLQSFCHSLLADKNGAIIAMNPNTGAVLAFVSHADFDPNIFVSANNSKEVLGLLNDEKNFPLLNRAISSAYPPGSVFKLVVTACALDSGVLDEKKTFFCGGSLRVGNRIFQCWNKDGHGTQIVNEGLKNSCNVFFYQLGLLVGADEISKYSFKFGFGRPTGIDLPAEASGFVPTEAWKRRELKEQWFNGETANFAIGQGYLLVTPIQVLCLTSAIANGGKSVRPFIVDRIEDVALSRAENPTIGLEDKAVEAIAKGMKDVINAPNATGVLAKSKSVLIAGKTGTAQNPTGRTHAWFAGFAPFENPRISIVVFLEHGGKGGMEPSRFAKEIIEEAKKLELL